ncbi:MAG: hypothetical protein ACO3RV_01495 [Luteolibacter sp.]
MNIRIIRWITLASMALASAGHAQLSASLKLTKKDHLAGEPVIAVVTITNYSGRNLVLQSDGRKQWLDFIINRSNKRPIHASNSALFGPMKINAGQTMSREVDLTQHFMIHEPGNYTVTGVIKLPERSKQDTTTNRAFFTMTQSRPLWSQRVGVMNGQKTREYRLYPFSGDRNKQLYAQVIDGESGQLIRTFPLGDILMIRKPLIMIDRKNRMHVMFLSTPSMWIHSVVDTDGRLVDRKIHRSTSQGDPRFEQDLDGLVSVINSIPYDPEMEKKRQLTIRKASERPNIPY